MKKAILVIFIVLALCTAGIAQSIPTLNDRVFIMAFESNIAVITFQIGPFGPSENGTCKLYINGSLIESYAYQYTGGDIVNVVGLSEFIIDSGCLTQITRGISLQEYSYVSH